MEDILHVGLDVGSTTVKIIVMDDRKNTIYKGCFFVQGTDSKNELKIAL